jgi:hypothetical protein
MCCFDHTTRNYRIASFQLQILEMFSQSIQPLKTRAHDGKSVMSRCIHMKAAAADLAKKHNGARKDTKSHVGSYANFTVISRPDFSLSLTGQPKLIGASRKL